MSKLIFGCGYLGKRVANLWRAQGHPVHVVTRSRRRAERLYQEGFHPLVADVTQPKTLGRLPGAETVVFAVGFDAAAGKSIAEVYAGGVKNVLAALPAAVQQIIYISTTGVYGPANGEWVDETTPPNPQRAGGKASLAAERVLAGKGILLRLAGIYGPDRIPYLDQLRAGKSLAVPSEGWLNLIHVDDAAQIVLAVEAWAALNDPPGDRRTFCVSDGHPVVRADYYREVARQIGAPPPVFVAPNQHAPVVARARADKRVSTARLTGWVQVPLAYPSYREGLASILSIP
ncbi:MAG: SDR family oxidoreductase [Pirellulales bacterium]|nr:SDR family oxidoreductase [Pirellulales bacterium]